MHVCMCTMLVCGHVGMCACVHVDMSACVYVCMCACGHVYHVYHVGTWVTGLSRSSKSRHVCEAGTLVFDLKGG